MGQFHSDFKLEDCKDIKSTYFIGLGKKSYLDVLEGINKITGEVNIDYHIRMKGIPNNTINYYCEQNKITVVELYEQLHDGKKIKFDLLCGGKDNVFSKPIFKNNKDMTISNLDKFEREVSF